jgi:aldehyde:ferredoxin oxidoreductase
MTLDELLSAGERIFDLKRSFNVREGITSADDILPVRVATGPGGKNLERLLGEYYSLRGWNAEGVPEGCAE